MAKFITDEHYEIAEKNGIPRKTVYHRVMYRDWEIEKAITKEVYGGAWKKYKHIAESNGISRDAFRDRVVRGYEPMEAATIPLRQAREKRVIPHEVKLLAQKNGIKMSTFHYRVYQLKWKPERAATEPLKKGGRTRAYERREKI